MVLLMEVGTLGDTVGHCPIILVPGILGVLLMVELLLEDHLIVV